jgi:NADPH-dependent 2,4-dienoyl-CoA reductase/sulfur reductase-like enzyme
VTRHPTTGHHDAAGDHRRQQRRHQRGLALHLNQRATRIDARALTVSSRQDNGQQRELEYDRLVIATGAVPQRPRSTGWTRNAGRKLA